MNTKQQGDIGVAAAIFHYTKQGHTVSIPATDNARYDLVVDMGKLRRVQVKTTFTIHKSGVYRVTLKTSGRNTTSLITSDECDLIFVYCGDGTTYEFPTPVLAGMTMANLGSKYEEYQI